MSDLVLTSFELAAEKLGDITDAVYARYFADCPGSEELMAHIDPGVKVKMMNEVLRLIMVDNYDDEQSYLNFEIDYHKSSFSVEQHMYGNLLASVQAVIQENLGDDWTTDMAAAWQARISTLQAEIEKRASA